MKNSKNILLSCISIILLFIASCKPERGPKEEQHYGPYYFREYANYFYFKPGTYWIYENNRTGELDTCTLISMKRDTISLFYEHSQYKRWYTRETIDYDISTRHRLGTVNYRTTRPCLPCVDLDSTRAINRDESPTGNLFYIPWNKYPQYSAFFPTMQIGSNTYYDVYRFYLEDDSGLPFWDDTKLLWGVNGSAQFSYYYWAKDIGLIQIKYKHTLDTGLDSAFWNLKSYNIIKF